jgi:DNA replication protein DnaC
MTTDMLLTRAKALKLHGLINHWQEVCDAPWMRQLIEWEEETRSYRGLERRLAQAKLEPFKSLAEFDWSWPTECDREAVEDLMQLDFLKSGCNIILFGPNGVGKSTIACNIGHQAALRGHTVLFTTAAKLLDDLAVQDGDQALSRRFSHYDKPGLLIIDEVGYLSYSNRHADLLFEVVSRRHQKRSTVITTNKPFNEWGQIFPNASCVVSLIDRLVHRSEIISIEAASFRLKDATDEADLRKQDRAERRKAKVVAKSTKNEEGVDHEKN